MKIILSRKGFDSSYGGGASPIMPNGDLISIPIPANENEKGIPYSKVFYGDKSYYQLMEELGIKIPENKCCHLDPDLIPAAYERMENWKGVFGQQGAALTHLENQGIGKGDIFLFFGSFKRTHLSDNIQFERDYERHIIFGYLIVGEIHSLGTGSSSLIYGQHPHFQNKELYKARNTLYVAENKEGYGTFKYRDGLVLTKNGFSKSMWELPMIFHPSKGTEISRHSHKDFELRGDKILFRSRGIGQDFVVKGNIEIEKWATKMIEESERIKPVINMGQPPKFALPNIDDNAGYSVKL